MKRITFVLILAGMTLLPVTVFGQVKTVKVAMSSQVLLDNLPIFVGMRAGFFEEAGLKLEPSYFRGGGEVVRAVTTRSVDLGATTAASAVLIASVRGEPIKIVAAAVSPLVGVVWVVPVDSPLKSIKDLKGKKAGFSSPGSVTHVSLQVILKEEGLDKDVQLVRVGSPGDSWAAVKNKVVDAGWHVSPSVYQLLVKKEARILFDATKYIKTYQQTVVSAMDDVIKKDPEMIRAFLKARAKATQFIWDQPEKTMAIWAEELKLPLETIRLAYRDLPRSAYETGAPKPENLQATAREVVDIGAVKEAPDLKKVLDLAYLPR